MALTLNNLSDWQQLFKATAFPWAKAAGGLHLKPKETDQIAAILGFAQFQECPLAVNESDARTLETPVWLDLSKLNTIREYSPADLTITVETGITIGKLNNHLKTDNLRFPLDYPEETPLIDVLAADATALNTGQQGYPRDWVLGAEIVTPDGKTTKCGGKVMKNVSGYDLVKLYVGSHNVLGVLTCVTLKLIAIEESTESLMANTGEFKQLVPLIKHVKTLKQAPTHFIITNTHQGFEVLIIYSGFKTVVNQAMAELTSALNKWGYPYQKGDEESLATIHQQKQRIPDSLPTLELTLPKEQLALFLDSSQTILEALNKEAGFQLVLIPDVPFIQCQLNKINTTAAGLFKQLAHLAKQINGTAYLKYAPKEYLNTAATINLPEEPFALELNQRLKQLYDPEHILFSSVLPFNYLENNDTP